MPTTDDKTDYRDRLAQAKRKVQQLPDSSQIRRALPEDFFQSLAKYIESTEDLQFGPWPSLFGFLNIMTKDQLAVLDDDLNLVLQNTDPKNWQDVTQFLRDAATGKVGVLYGRLFDIWVRATLLKLGQTVEFDVPLGNGRDTDIRLELPSRHIRLENTVITQDDEAREVWDRFLDDKKVDPDKILMRPGPYDPPDAKGPSPYYNTLRLYAKVFDKIAKHLDPDKAQCSDDEPNVLLISFWGIGVSPTTPGYGWALDELFDDQPSMGGRIVPGPHLHDISLDAWIDFTAADLVRRGVLTVEQYDARMRHYGEIIAAPRRLSGVILFDGFKLTTARINYNARSEYCLSHAEMAALESLVGDPPEYSH